MSAHRTTPWAAAIAAAAAAACLALAGCGGSSPAASTSQSPGSSASTSSGSSSSSSGNAAAIGKLTGNFCTDFKNIGTNLQRFPAADQNDPAALQRDGAKYLSDAAAYFNGLAGEAPSDVGAELRTIASAYQSLANSLASGNVVSAAQAEQQLGAIVGAGSTGTAFRNLITYMVTKCGA